MRASEQRALDYARLCAVWAEACRLVELRCRKVLPELDLTKAREVAALAAKFDRLELAFRLWASSEKGEREKQQDADDLSALQRAAEELGIHLPVPLGF